MSVITAMNLTFDALKTYVESMSVNAGYLLDWGVCNYEDRAVKYTDGYDAHCIVSFDDEENIDIDDGVTNNWLNEFNIILQIRVPMTLETTNPDFDIRVQLDKGLADLKLMFGRHNCLGLSHLVMTLYQGCEPNFIGRETGDRFLPYVYDVEYMVQYLQEKVLI